MSLYYESKIAETWDKEEHVLLWVLTCQKLPQNTAIQPEHLPWRWTVRLQSNRSCHKPDQTKKQEGERRKRNKLKEESIRTYGLSTLDLGRC